MLPFRSVGLKAKSSCLGEEGLHFESAGFVLHEDVSDLFVDGIFELVEVFGFLGREEAGFVYFEVVHDPRFLQVCIPIERLLDEVLGFKQTYIRLQVVDVQFLDFLACQVDFFLEVLNYRAGTSREFALLFSSLFGSSLDILLNYNCVCPRPSP